MKLPGQQRQLLALEPKTKRSRRQITVDETTIAVLLAHQTRQENEQRVVGEHFRDQGYVFARPTGDPLVPGHVSQHWEVIRGKAGLSHIRLHDLRHTHATMLLAANVHPKVAAERLGHSTVNLFLDTYSHVLPTMQDDVTRKLGVLLPKVNT